MSALFRWRFHGQSILNVRNLYVSVFRPKIIHYKLSDIGEGIAEVQVKEWHINAGDHVNEFDEICTVQSDKAAVTITSRYSGLVKKLHYEVDDIVKVGAALIDIDDGKNDEATVVQNSVAEPIAGSVVGNSSTENSLFKKFLATPAVRRLIRENDLDLSSVTGTGRDGRILKEDILKHISGVASPITTKAEAVESKSIEVKQTVTTRSIPLTPQEPERTVPIRGYTRAMIKSMTEALKIPHFGYNDEFVVDKLMQLRNDLNETRGDRQKLSYMPLVIKATSLALKEFPVLNSSIDGQMENLIYKSYHNISLAMDTPGGLAVPNIKNCEAKNVWEIAAELQRLLELGQKQMFSNADLTNGTFSLSNIGAIGGGTYMKPIIFPPQVAIGAIGRIRHVTRVDETTGVPYENSVLNFSWAADHRVIDGATMARFSNRLKQFVENPALMVGELA